MDKHLILLDTDIGCDIDDWYCLSYLLAREDVEILGITTNTGNAIKRAELADAICRLAGKPVKVCAGSEHPIIGGILQKNLVASEAEVLAEYMNPENIIQESAVDFMCRIIKQNPGRVELVSIGALTNSARLFIAHPETAGMLKSMTVMGGRFADKPWCRTEKWGEIEWNIRMDPVAAAIVFDSCVREMIIIGVEQSCRMWQPAEAVVSVMKGHVTLEPAARAVSGWKDGTWFHDALAAMALLEPELFEWQRGRADCEIFAHTPGKVSFSSDKGVNHRLLTDADPAVFFGRYSETLGIELPYTIPCPW